MFPEAASYLKTLEKCKEKWVICYNQDVFMGEMSSTQRGESMNNLMKGYMDASTFMSGFLNAFESALDSRRQDVEFIKYKETTLNIIYKTISPFEKQAASILTIYALKKFQEQLLQSSCYKCEEVLVDSESLILQDTGLNLKVFHVTRFETSSSERIVEYNLLDELFTCTCRYMTFAGIICRHILCVATQLNLDSFSKKMYLLRWCKDPTEVEIMHQYKTFYSLQSHYATSSKNRFVNQKPETAPIFNESLSILLKAQITSANNEYNNNWIRETDNIIRNPQNIKAKGGRVVNEEISNKENNPSNIMYTTNRENSNKDNDDLDVTVSDVCPYCEEKLPSFLSTKLKELLVKYQGKKLNVVEQFKFCRIHIAETKIIPDGVEKGYLMEIDFSAIPKRVEIFRSDLLDICKKKVKSVYRENVMRAYREIGKNKANTPMGIMNRIENFQPGYYGLRGAVIIAETLRTLFIDTKILTKSLASPQTPMEYLQEVLIPEAAVRLIQEDYKGIQIENVREIMLQSVHFGAVVHDE
ncbi:protein FAR1-RELATED SEQUENCE 5 [Rhizophagus irregularis DAOM 181602=DAOM 197198]|nr:protein FAR1-RELATED SEQUENCE 5 [Rhizophagus irregularis DAOM 181602=DAOM 197198]CAG8752085.1 12920_t:CDS:2 [Rhizophagus irregularis]